MKKHCPNIHLKLSDGGSRFKPWKNEQKKKN